MCYTILHSVLAYVERTYMVGNIKKQNIWELRLPIPINKFKSVKRATSNL